MIPSNEKYAVSAVTELAESYAYLAQKYMDEQRIVSNLITENTKLEARIRELEDRLSTVED